MRSLNLSPLLVLSHGLLRNLSLFGRVCYTLPNSTLPLTLSMSSRICCFSVVGADMSGVDIADLTQWGLGADTSIMRVCGSVLAIVPPDIADGSQLWLEGTLSTNKKTFTCVDCVFGRFLKRGSTYSLYPCSALTDYPPYPELSHLLNTDTIPVPQELKGLPMLHLSGGEFFGLF